MRTEGWSERATADAWVRQADPRTCLALVEAEDRAALEGRLPKEMPAARWDARTVLLTLPLDDAELTLEQLRRSLAESLTVSIGFTARRSGETPEVTVARLEGARQRARTLGGNRVEGYLAGSDGSLVAIGLTGGDRPGIASRSRRRAA